MNTSFIIGNLKYFIAYLKLFLNSPNIKLRKAGYTCLIWMDISSTKIYESWVDILDILDIIYTGLVDSDI